jgi:hypothetical protein
VTDDREVLEWLLQVLVRLKLLSHGDPCQDRDRAEEWIREKLKGTE